MVGRQVLVLLVGVRIPAREPKFGIIKTSFLVFEHLRILGNDAFVIIMTPSVHAYFIACMSSEPPSTDYQLWGSVPRREVFCLSAN